MIDFIKENPAMLIIFAAYISGINKLRKNYSEEKLGVLIARGICFIFLIIIN